jgi:nitrogenase molybdenum-iron protein NifN
MVLRGIEGCIPLIHGSQGCSTYIRRYAISHFREPLDIASSNFVEAAAIFGGRDNLFTALDNVSRSYRPLAIGIASTCLSETIGENVPMYLKQYKAERAKGLRNNGACNPAIFYASTPSYRGTHMDGFHEAIWAAVTALAETEGPADHAAALQNTGGNINLISGFVSAGDLRELHAILASFGVPYTLLPDYSESLDGPAWETYQKLPAGGTGLEDIRNMDKAAGTLYLGAPPGNDAGKWLEETCGVPLFRRELPIGIENCDAFFDALEQIAARPMDRCHIKDRGRLIDAYIDGHKYVNGKRAVIYGEEDFVCALASFLDEIGVIPVIAASGAEDQGGQFAERLRRHIKNSREHIEVLTGADFASILERARELGIDFVMGHSKGLYLSRNLGVPLIRCGFPIHDRMGGHRITHLGYRGTLNLFDLVCNALMEAAQNRHDKGYTYL